jgi:Cys-rich four helix bundle protein (predicted Tat secretion target)
VDLSLADYDNHYDSNKGWPVERREFIENAALLTVGLAAAGAASAQATEASIVKASPLLLQKSETVKALPHFAETATACVGSGQLCEQHCQEQLANGATEFSACSIAVGQMVVLCSAVGKLAAMKSVRLSEVLDACANACKACKDACEEHKAHWKKGMHLECKACAEHCEKMIAAVAKLKALLASA